MDRLILFRHGKAEHHAPGGEDFDRCLTPRGERESRAMAETLADMGFAPDLVLVSTAARTRGTWAAAEPVFPKARVVFEDELYHAESGVVRQLARRAGQDVGTVMVVGHNPGLQELTVEFLREGACDPALVSRANNQFPTATAAVFLFDAAERPAYDGLFFPQRDRG